MTRALVAHPGTQHAFQLASELSRRGLLAGFCTGFAVGGGSWGEVLIDSSMSPLRRLLANRRAEAVPAKLLHLQIGLELAAQLRGLLSSKGETMVHWRNEWFQRAVPDRNLREADVVIGFDTSSWLLAERCHKLDRPFILVQTIGHPLEKERVFERLRRQHPDWKFTLPQKSAAHIANEQEEHRLAKIIVAPSRYVRQTLTSNGVDESKVRVVPFGADIGKFRPAPSGTARSNRTMAFLFVGHISARKGIPTLLEAWRSMRTNAAELWLVGSGDIPRSHARGLHSSIKFLGEKGQADVAKIMQAADVFVFPSFFEGMAKVQVEALSSGLPVIGTKESGAEDLVEDGENGFVVNAGDSQQLAARMAQLLDDRRLLAHMRRAAIGRRDRYSWSVYGDRWANVLQKAAI